MAQAGLVDDSRDFRLKIRGMDCAECARTLEKGVGRLGGVDNVEVDFTTELMRGRGRVRLDEIAAKVRDLGYNVVGSDAAPEVALADARGLRGFLRYFLSYTDNQIALAGALVLVAGFAATLASPSPSVVAVVDGLSLIVAVVLTYPLAIKGGRALVKTGRVTIDLLMTVAVGGAVFIGATGEAATVALLFTLGEALEGYSAERSRESLRSLLNLQPKKATVMRAHADGHDDEHDDACDGEDHHRPVHYHRIEVAVEDVQVGETVLVRPGEQIPIDGRIGSGSSSINQAPITGEAVPVSRTIGDEVFASTINGEGALEIETTRPASDSTVAQIGRLVEQAQAQRSPAERFIDRFAAWYTPAVVALAVLMVVVAVAVFGQPLLETGEQHGWLYRALALLIIACPCALVISIPVTVVSALTRLAQLGILVKGGALLGNLSRIKVFAFDKTGTLTRGRPVVTGMQTINCTHDGPANDDCGDCDDMLALASAVESGSEHPMAHAVLSEARRRDVIYHYPVASSITAIAGGGVKGDLDGRTITVGRRDVASVHGEGLADQLLSRFNGKSQSMMVIARDSMVVGCILAEDEPRQEASRAVRRLHDLVPGTHVVMLTGDHAGAATQLAQRIGGIDEVRAGLRPADKLQVVTELNDKYGDVAMIGDGINDTPALARAEVGIAMGGSGTAQAMEVADVVLMRDDLNLLTSAVRISRRTQQVLRQNIALSLALKGVFLLLAVPGLTTLWMAVFADVGATLLVTLNGMRLLRERLD